MGRFIIKNVDCKILPSQLMGEFYSKKTAYDAILNYAKNENINREDNINPIQLISSYQVEKVKTTDFQIKSFDEAKKILGDDMLYKTTTYDEINALVDNINPNHIEALNALNKLFTIAQAWNKKDNFVPDFSNRKQDKWAPNFMYNKSESSFILVDVSNVSVFNLDTCFGCHICFRTKELASRFGEQFVDLFNKVFM